MTINKIKILHVDFLARYSTLAKSTTHAYCFNEASLPTKYLRNFVNIV